MSRLSVSLLFISILAQPAFAAQGGSGQQSHGQAAIQRFIEENADCFGDGREGEVIVDWDHGTASAKGRTITIMQAVNCGLNA